MGTRAAQADPGDNPGRQRVRGRHARTDSVDSQATAVEDDDQLVLDGKRPRKRAVENDDADDVLEAKRLRVTPGTAAEPTDAQTGSPDAAALNTVTSFTAATPAVVADPNQRKQQISQLLCGIVHAVAASVRPTDGETAASGAPPTVSDRIAAANKHTSVERQVAAALLAAQNERERQEAALPVQTVNAAAVAASVRPAAPSAAPVLPDHIAAANKYTSVEKRATAAQVAAQNERERHEAAERARVEEIARRCLPVSATDAKGSRPPTINFNMVHSSPPRFSSLKAGDNGVNNLLAVAEDKNLVNRNHSHLACIAKGGDCADYDVAPCPCCIDDQETERLRYRVALALAPTFL